jgi:large subunit ribosomal protein L19
MQQQAIMAQVERENIQERTTNFAPGDLVVVTMKIREGDKERLQPFQGTVVQMSGAGRGRTFTVRKASGSVYVERIFPVNSPMITEIRVVRKGKVRRARLFYLRDLAGKATRIESKGGQDGAVGTAEAVQPAQPAQPPA